MPCGIRGVWILDLGATGEWFVSFVMRNAELLVNRGARNWPHPALRAILPEGEAMGSLALTQVWDTQWAFFSTFVEHSPPRFYVFCKSMEIRKGTSFLVGWGSAGRFAGARTSLVYYGYDGGANV